jgi:hypothetical protein
MADLMDFTSSLAELPEVNATMERWLYGTRELERRMSERIIFLCRYFDRIPEKSLSDYADVLSKALAMEKLESGFLKSEHLNRSITAFAEHLRNLGDPTSTKKADLILKMVREKFQIAE